MKARFVSSFLVTVISAVEVKEGENPLAAVDDAADLAIQDAKSLFDFIQNSDGEVLLVHNTTLMHTE